MRQVLRFDVRLQQLPKEKREYILGMLASHLAETKNSKDKLLDLLTDYGYLQAKLDTRTLNELIADFHYMTDHAALQTISTALQLSASALEMDAQQLAGQLLGRLRRGDLKLTVYLLRQQII